MDLHWSYDVGPYTEGVHRGLEMKELRDTHHLISSLHMASIKRIIGSILNPKGTKRVGTSLVRHAPCPHHLTSHLIECNDLMVLEIHLPLKIVDLLFTITNRDGCVGGLTFKNYLLNTLCEMTSPLHIASIKDFSVQNPVL